MGAFLYKPNTDKFSDSGDGNGLRYGVSSMQGWRLEMEDAHAAVTSLCDLPDWSFFAVFDGHAGANVSAHCSKKLLSFITSNDHFLDSKNSDSSQPTMESVHKGLKSGFLNLDDAIRKLPDIQEGKDKSGSTAVCALVSPSHIFFANLGDSRGLLASNNDVKFSTEDHKPENPEEKERIQNAGGSVMIHRVNGTLAVSRAFGDFEYKNVEGKGPCEQLVSPEPDIFDIERTPEDEFIVLACDGIWDVMTNEGVQQFVRDRMKVTDNLKTICDLVIDTCLCKGSRDNMSVVIIALSNAIKVEPEAVERDEKLNKYLDELMTEIVTNSKVESFAQAFRLLSEKDISNLPPGGGLASKQMFVQEVYRRLCPESKEKSQAE